MDKIKELEYKLEIAELKLKISELENKLNIVPYYNNDFVVTCNSLNKENCSAGQFCGCKKI